MPEERKHVPWTIFIWVVGIVSILLVGMFATMQTLSAKIEEASKDNTGIKVQLSQIQTDILWIREKLSERQ